VSRNRIKTARRASAAVVAAALAVGTAPTLAAGPPPRITSGPEVSGSATVGGQLTATATFQPVRSGENYTTTAMYTWLRCVPSAPEDCQPVAAGPAATTTTYAVQPADAGAVMRARLTVTVSSAGHDRTAVTTSGPTAAVPAPPPDPAPEPPPPTPSPPAPAPALVPPPAPTVSAGSVLAQTAPRLLRPFPIVRIKGFLTARGARVMLLTVRAPLGARISLRCEGTGCPRRRWARAAVLVHVRPFEQRVLRAGVRLTIRVTRRGRIGKYTSILLRRGRPPLRVDRCLYPGSTQPRRCPSA
jgi:hypothetical protein